MASYSTTLVSQLILMYMTALSLLRSPRRFGFKKYWDGKGCKTFHTNDVVSTAKSPLRLILQKFNRLKRQLQPRAGSDFPLHFVGDRYRQHHTSSNHRFWSALCGWMYGVRTARYRSGGNHPGLVRRWDAKRQHVR